MLKFSADQITVVHITQSPLNSSAVILVQKLFLLPQYRQLTVPLASFSRLQSYSCYSFHTILTEKISSNTRFHGLKYSSAKQSSATCQNSEKLQTI